MGITSSAVGLKICPITTGIKKYKSIIKKTEKKHDEIVLLGKTKLNNISTLVFMCLVNSYAIIDDEFVSGNVLNKYNEMKSEIKNPETSVEHSF